MLRLVIAAVGLITTSVAAETHVEVINETRLNLFYAVPEAEALALLPEGWTVASAPGGPVAGANVLVSVIDRIAATAPDGKPLEPPQNRLVVLVVTGRNAATGEVAPVVVRGWSDEAAGAPGAYGNFVDAEVRFTRTMGSSVTDSIAESWSVTAPDGDGLTIDAVWPRGQASYSRFDQRVHSASKPGFFRIYRGDQGTVLLHSTPLGVVRATILSVRASGPLLGSLIDGDARLVAAMHLPWYRRDSFLP